MPFLITVLMSFVSWNMRRPDLPVAFNGIALGTVAAVVIYHVMNTVARVRGTA